MNQPLSLPGCTPEPLGNYLKALGLFRLVSEQADPNARAWWKKGCLWLQTGLSRTELEEFFLVGVGTEKSPVYAPTPIFAPWGGRPGFYANGNTKARELQQRLMQTAHVRFDQCRETLQIITSLLAARGWIDDYEKVTKKDATKQECIRACRMIVPPAATEWFDAAIAMEESATYGALFGTGGNEGSTDLTNNFLELVEDALGFPTPKPFSNEVLQAALFLAPRSAGSDVPGGQSFPSTAEAPNAGQDFVGKTSTNPWDVVLMMEGCVLFAGALTKRLSQYGKGKAAFPFMLSYVATDASGESVREQPKQDVKSEKCRAEFWMPIWNQPCSLADFKAMLAEGRLQHRNGANAEHSVRAMEAVAALGVSRGIRSFKRFGLFERRGQGYYIASQLGDFIVPDKPVRSLDLIEQIDEFRNRAYTSLREGPRVPDRVLYARANLEKAVARVLRRDIGADGVDAASLVGVVVGAAQLEREVSTLKDHSKMLRPCQWLCGLWQKRSNGLSFDDGTEEFRLASAVAAIAPWGKVERDGRTIPAVDAIRCNLLPISRDTSATRYWNWDDTSRSAVWSTSATLLDNFARVMQRRLIDTTRGAGVGLPLASFYGASFSDLLKLWNQQLDETRIADLIHGLSLMKSWASDDEGRAGDTFTPDLSPTAVWFDALDQPHATFELPRDLSGRDLLSATDVQAAFELPRGYALLKLCFLGGRLPPRPIEKQAARSDGTEPYPSASIDILRMLSAGRMPDAMSRAAAKLKALGYPTLIPDAALRSAEFDLAPSECRRLAGLLLIPIRHPGALASLVIKPKPF